MIQKKKFVKTFRNTKTVQLILLLLLETAYVLVLTLNPALGTKLFEDRTLFILCTLSWILALFNLIWLLYDFYKLRTFVNLLVILIKIIWKQFRHHVMHSYHPRFINNLP